MPAKYLLVQGLDTRIFCSSEKDETGEIIEWITLWRINLLYTQKKCRQSIHAPAEWEIKCEVNKPSTSPSLEHTLQLADKDDFKT
jgi:hypothetical protein